MRSVETTGKTVEEAKELAAQELGIPVDQIEFEVLDEGGKSFLGLSRAAHVRAKVVEDAEAEVRTEEEPAPMESGPEARAEEDEEAEAVEGPKELAEEHEEIEPVKELEAVPVGEAGEWVLSLLRNVLAAAELDATATLGSATEEAIDIDMEGPDVAILIGKHGQTLDALQYLIGLAAGRATGSRARLTLDAEGYRERHAEALTAKALEYARRVTETGEEAVLDPQSARDRRIVHLALAGIDEVYTYSEGEGPDRHVVISPKK